MNPYSPSGLQAPLPLAPQTSTVQPEEFQSKLIAHISAALQTPERTQRPPCLLRAPTGSGKTFVLGQVLQQVGQEREVLWFWFVPFVTLARRLSAEKREAEVSRETWAQADAMFDWPDGLSTAQFWRAPAGHSRA